MVGSRTWIAVACFVCASGAALASPQAGRGLEAPQDLTSRGNAGGRGASETENASGLTASERRAATKRREALSNAKAAWRFPGGSSTPSGSPFDALGGLGGAAPGSATEPLLPAARSRLPDHIRRRLEWGPLSHAEATDLVRELSGYRQPTKVGLSPTDMMNEPEAPTVGGEMALAPFVLDRAHRDKVSEFDPGADPSTVQPLDNRLLRIWFGELDRDRDESVRFFEFQDATREGLELFRTLDLDRSGTIQFDEFAGPVVLIAERERLDVHETLLRWVSSSPIDFDTLSAEETAARESRFVSNRLEQVVARARAALQPNAPRIPVEPLPYDPLSSLDAPEDEPLRGDRQQIADTLAARLFPLPAERVSTGWIRRSDTAGRQGKDSRSGPPDDVADDGSEGLPQD